MQLARLAVATSMALGCGTTSGAGGGGGGAAVTTCDGLRPKLEQLYRAEAEAKEPKRVDEAVADNTAMVLGDCAKAPATVIACVGAATSVVQLEQTCLAPLDDEGSDGEALKR